MAGLTISVSQLARDGDLKRISEVLASQESARENMNELDAKENSPLHYACRYTHLKVVNRLLDFKGRRIVQCVRAPSLSLDCKLAFTKEHKSRIMSSIITTNQAE